MLASTSTSNPAVQSARPPRCSQFKGIETKSVRQKCYNKKNSPQPEAIESKAHAWK